MAGPGGSMTTPLGNTLALSQGGIDSSQNISTGGPEDWFGPGNPLKPVAPPEVAGRGFDIPFSYNMSQRVRPYEAISMHTLRAFAQSYDLLRLVIETRKDQMVALDWNIVPKDKKANIAPGSPLANRIQQLEAFWRRPDPIQNQTWDDWLKMLLEDLFVIDAPSLYVHRTRGGELFRLKVMDGGTIKPVIDDWGDPPQPPFAAYQQILKGMAAVNYTTDDLIYRPRNRRSDKVYGFSPVEQIIAIINIGIKRETWQVNFFTHGTLPDALIGTPNEWTPQQLKNFQDWFDLRLAGNTGNRRGATFVPGEVAKGYVPTKTEELFGKAEEWLARVVSYAFSVSPQWAVMQMNRATAETAKSTAEEEGLVPLKKWVKNRVDEVIERVQGIDDLEFAWKEDEELDPSTQAEVLKTYVDAGIYRRNEAREILGKDPDPAPEANQLTITTASGPVPVGLDAQIEASKKKMEAMPPPPAAPAESGQPGAQPPKPGEKPPSTPAEGGGKPASAAKASPHNHGAQKRAASAVTPGWRRLDPIDANRPKMQRIAKGFSRGAAKAFAEASADVSAQVGAALKKAGVLKVAKADPPDHGDGQNNDTRITAVPTLTPPEPVDVDALIANLDLSSLDVLYDVFEEGLFDAFTETATKAIAQIGVKSEAQLTNVVNEAAVKFARERAAELVGKQWRGDELIDNPSPKWSIDEATRSAIRNTIADGLEQNIGRDAIADALQANYAFSPERAATVANTEIRNVNEQSKLEGWRQAETDGGFKILKVWQVSNDEDEVCDICEANAAQGAIALDADFESGDDASPAHPNCQCVTVPEISDAADDPSDE